MNIQEYIESGILEEYALGVLPEAERAEVERQLLAHPELRRELSSIEAGLDLYAQAHAVTPPPAVRERVLAGWQAAIRSQAPQTLAETAVRPVAEPVASPAEATVRSITSAPEPAAQYDEPRRTSYSWAMAASVALLLSLGGNVLFYNRWQQAETSLAVAQSEQARVASAVQAVEKRLNTRDQEVAVLRNEQFRTVTLAGTSAAPKAKARVLYNPATRAVYVDVRNLPAPPPGKQYQLWALDNGKPVDAGVLTQAAAAGDSLQQMKDIASAQAFAMTVEPAGGSENPTLSTMTVLGKM